jgi:hypothetical protein
LLISFLAVQTVAQGRAEDPSQFLRGIGQHSQTLFFRARSPPQVFPSFARD